ncbi:MAG TPA: hypothetical protein P5080_01045 [Candidatus Paceibacterota bacterium]|nr:hypothetical protein [Candidatus Pacearchaeota archaeon]HRZ50559.1 hypothetical protein [Candidatus Paceibacterota bacterium]HSA36280.1 hypothetical protein [Candidatus Paceibacterota bacterium]
MINVFKNHRYFEFGKLLRSLISGFLIILIVLPSLMIPAPVWAYFSRTRSSDSNTFRIGMIDFSLVSPAEFPEINAQVGVSERAIRIIAAGTIDFQYDVGIQAATTTLDVCDNLLLDASLGNSVVYSGPLVDFAYDAGEYASSTAEWSFSARVDNMASVIYDSDCYFDIIFRARQLYGTGFSHIENLPSHIRVVRNTPDVDVIYPDGGQHWYVVAPQCPRDQACSKWCTERKPDAMNANCQYNIRWTAHNPYGPDSDLLIDIYYSNDSGRHWLPKINPAPLPNTGSYLWMLPYDTAYVTHTARIKVVAYGRNNAAFVGEAVSERDFCPPMMSMEDLMNQIAAEEEASNSGRASAAPQAISDAALPPSDIAPMPPQDIVEAIDIIRNATSTETTGDSVLLDPGRAIEIVPFAAPGSGNPGQAVEAITGPPAIIPQQSNEENATSTPIQ